MHCPKSIELEECISQIEISRCDELGRGEDENLFGAGVIGASACYGLAAFLKENISICQNLSYRESKGNCEYWVEFLTKATMKDVSYCENMVDHTRRGLCFTHAAWEFKNEKYCEPSTRQHLRDHCYYVVAQEIQGEHVCEKIVDSQTQKACYSYLEKL